MTRYSATGILISHYHFMGWYKGYFPPRLLYS